MAAPANGSGAVSQSNGKGIFTVMDSVDQPKLKGQGRMKRTRFSIRRHLQKHGLAHADSDSDLESEDSEWAIYFNTVLNIFIDGLMVLCGRKVIFLYSASLTQHLFAIVGLGVRLCSHVGGPWLYRAWSQWCLGLQNVAESSIYLNEIEVIREVAHS